MDVGALRLLIARGETMEIEFKRSVDVDALSDRDLAAALACLANGDGGMLLMGVENDGTITGVGPRHGETTDIGR